MKDCCKVQPVSSWGLSKLPIKIITKSVIQNLRLNAFVSLYCQNSNLIKIKKFIPARPIIYIYTVSVIVNELFCNTNIFVYDRRRLFLEEGEYQTFLLP